MSVSVNDKNIGHVTAYAYAKSKGYTGSPDEFAQLMADYATVGQEAAQSASEAAQSASDASGSAAAAEAAKTAAQTAKTGAETAQTGAQAAKTAAETAQGKAETAQGKAETAQAAAESAKTAAAGSASAAATSATNAGNSATAAAGSATAAQTAKTGAETAQAAAETAKTGAETAAASVSASAEQIETNKNDITELKDNVQLVKDTLEQTTEDALAAYVTDIASGVIASFPDGADGVQVKELTVNIDPVQDLHGQANPYPAGGGKNKCKPINNGTFNGVTVSTDATGKTTVTGTATSGGGRLTLCSDPFILPAGTYTVSHNGSGTWGYSINLSAPGGSSLYDCRATFTSTTITLSAETTFVVGITIESGKTYSGTIQPQIESGSIKTDYVPYSNICPISGHTSAVVTRTGINVWDEQWENGRINVTTGALIVDSTHLRSKNYIRVISETNYYAKTTNAGYVVFYDANHSCIGNEYIDAGGKSFATPNNCVYAKFFVTTSTYNHDISINYPSTDHDYHEGHVQTVTIDLTGTIYGGTLDVTTGVLTMDRQIVDLGTLNWTQSNTTAGAPYPKRWLSNAVSGLDGDVYSVNCISNKYKGAKYSGSSSDVDALIIGKTNNVISSEVRGYINVVDVSLDDMTPAQVKEALSGTYAVCRSVAQTIQLPSTEVRTLLAQNNIFSDAGDTTVQYRADTKLYIDKKDRQNFASLIAPTEAAFMASRNYTTGSLFIVNDVLYKATVNIANGGAITPNSNCTATTLAEVISALS